MSESLDGIYEIGFICKYEGGHGCTVLCEDNLLPLAKAVLIYQAKESVDDWKSMNEDGFWNTSIEQVNNAIEYISNSKSVKELRKIYIEEPSWCVIIEKVNVSRITDYE